MDAPLANLSRVWETVACQLSMEVDGVGGGVARDDSQAVFDTGKWRRDRKVIEPPHAAPGYAGSLNREDVATEIVALRPELHGIDARRIVADANGKQFRTG
jgi:hypothetical protein